MFGPARLEATGRRRPRREHAGRRPLGRLASGASRPLQRAGADRRV